MDYDYLTVKIAFSLFGNPSNLNEDDNEVKISSYNEGQHKCTNPIFDWLSAKSTSEIKRACIFLIIKQYDQQYKLPVISFVSSEVSELFLDNYGRVYKTWVNVMKLNELPKCLYHYPVDDRYKRSSGDDNDHNTNSIDMLVDFSSCPDPEIVEWMKNGRRSQEEDSDRLADKDYDSFFSEDYD